MAAAPSLRLKVALAYLRNVSGEREPRALPTRDESEAQKLVPAVHGCTQPRPPRAGGDDGRCAPIFRLESPRRCRILRSPPGRLRP